MQIEPIYLIFIFGYNNFLDKKAFERKTIIITLILLFK